MGVQYIRSERGGQLLLWAGYRYNIKRQRQDMSTMWRCANRSCKARCIIDNSGFKMLKKKAHTICKPDPIGNEICFALNKCKIRLHNCDEDIRTIYNEEFSYLIERGYGKRLPPLKKLYNLKGKSRRHT